MAQDHRREQRAQGEDRRARVRRGRRRAGSRPAAPAPVVTAAPAAGGESPLDASTGIIAVAQRVHDEYVAEGQAKSNQILAEAESRAQQIISQAEVRQREELDRLNTERSGLEQKIGELREFENSYRSQLRGYFEGQLRQLNSEQPQADSVPSLGQ
ncbi:cell division protein [Microbacterium sp. NIBRBAC000506063]|uniref:cell division protein n=1 Tax=Microbacterium sp. NIBRBAC000506063 TaxID=2734618 RepID=UPI002948C395|nr:cell division protein [Microbacterium sp. NIBRBAC000506063]